MGRVIVQPDKQTVHLTDKGNIVLHANGNVTVEWDKVVEAVISRPAGKMFRVELLEEKEPGTDKNKVEEFEGRQAPIQPP
jgi:hypothetical protein